MIGPWIKLSFASLGTRVLHKISFFRIMLSFFGEKTVYSKSKFWQIFLKFEREKNPRSTTFRRIRFHTNIETLIETVVDNSGCFSID